MNKLEQDIIDGTKDFAKVNDIHYDELTESMILNAIREVNKQLNDTKVVEVKTTLELIAEGKTEGLMKTYHVNKHEINPKIRKITQFKRNIVLMGLPVQFESEDKQTIGKVELNNKCDIIVNYSMIRGKVFNEGSHYYLIDIDDNTLKQYNFLNNYCEWRKGDYGMMGCSSYEYVTTCGKNYDCDKTQKENHCPNCGKKII